MFYNDDEEGIFTEWSDFISVGMEVAKVDVNGELLSEATFEVFLDHWGVTQTPAFPTPNGNMQFTTVNGEVFIPHFLPGNTYYLEEVESPAGYRRITERMRIEVSDNTINNYIMSISVVNDVEGGFILPETGGVGTVMFTVVGIGLIGTAVSLILYKRRGANTQ